MILHRRCHLHLHLYHNQISGSNHLVRYNLNPLRSISRECLSSSTQSRNTQNPPYNNSISSRGWCNISSRYWDHHQHLNYDTGKCTVDTINIVSIVSETLSKGIEHPEIYLDIFNLYLKQQGYESIIIPKPALNISKNVFHFKNPDKSKTNIPFLTLYTPPSEPTFHIPVQC